MKFRNTPRVETKTFRDPVSERTWQEEHYQDCCVICEFCRGQARFTGITSGLVPYLDSLGWRVFEGMRFCCTTCEWRHREKPVTL